MSEKVQERVFIREEQKHSEFFDATEPTPLPFGNQMDELKRTNQISMSPFNSNYLFLLDV